MFFGGVGYSFLGFLLTLVFFVVGLRRDLKKDKIRKDIFDFTSGKEERLFVIGYGVWVGERFYPSRKLTEQEFRYAVSELEKERRENGNPDYRYKGLIRLNPPKGVF